MAGTLIVALDVDTRREAESIVNALDGTADFFKIGYQLFYGGDGLALGKELLAAGKRVFFDLKLLDIDNTVERGVAAIARTGATMPAVKGAAGSDLTILGVSVLTSMDDNDVAEAGFTYDTAGLVSLRAGQAKAAGVGGLVCSPLEAEMVREIVGPQMALVTPGIRPAGSTANDQKRVLGPAEAIAAGASHLVVGRPITAAADPAAAACQVLGEMQGHAFA
jgi:orotidine-5'-phosphate decarboxylase